MNLRTRLDSADRPWRCACLGLLVAVCLLLTACSSLSSVTGFFKSQPKPATPDWSSVVITAEAGANQNSPVALDLVFIKDAAMVDALLAMPSAKWFSSRADLIRSFPDALSVMGFEMVPEQSIRLSPKQIKGREGLAAVVFADYPGSGEHRQKLTMEVSGLVLTLGSKDFKVTEIK